MYTTHEIAEYFNKASLINISKTQVGFCSVIQAENFLDNTLITIEKTMNHYEVSFDGLPVYYYYDVLAAVENISEH